MNSIQDLQYHRDIVALEAFGAPGISMRDLLHRTLPGVVKTFTHFVGLFNPSEESIHLTSKQQSFLKLVSKHKYLDLAPITAYVPEGMDETYLEYANVLQSAVDHALKVEEQLNLFTTYLSILVTNHQQQYSTRNNAVVYQGLQTSRNELNRSLGNCFKNGSTKAEVNYGKVVSRNADWEYVFGASEKLSKEMNKVDRKLLNKKVKETAVLLDKVMGMLERGQLASASPELVQEMAEGAYQIACELEFFSVTYYRVMTYVTGVNNTVENVTRVIDN